jgi:hypothetical protein
MTVIFYDRCSLASSSVDEICLILKYDRGVHTTTRRTMDCCLLEGPVELRVNLILDSAMSLYPKTDSNLIRIIVT